MKPRKQDRCDHCEKKAVQQRCAAHAKICTVHADATHGREADELRTGIEALIGEGHAHVEDLRSALIDLSNAVDARDSLAFCERRPERELRTARAVLGWKTRKANEKKRAAADKREARLHKTGKIQGVSKMSNTSKTRNLKTSTKCGYCGAPRPDAEDTPRPGEVSTSLLTPTEIAIARAEGRLRVTVNGLGFVTVKASGADSADVRPADPITASRPAEAPKEPGTSSPRSPRLRSRGERRSVMYILKAGRIGWYATGFTTGVVASAAQRDAARWPSRKGAADARKRLIAAGTRGLGESPKDWRIVRLRPRVKG